MGIPGGMAAAEVHANVDAMRVTPDNVLQIRNALLAESLVLREHLDQASQAAVVGKPGADEVSRRAAPAFNATIMALFEECRAYVAALADVAGRLGGMAQGYGYTTQQINDSFEKFQPHYPAPTNAQIAPSVE